jgi:hypothetical protein
LHKQLTKCTGVPDRTKYISIKQYTDTDMKSDMTMLLDISKSADLTHKHAVKMSRYDNRKRFTFLLDECRRRGLNVRMQPKSMSRHEQNSTIYQKAEERIYWHMEWRYVTCELGELVLQIPTVNEDLNFAQILETTVATFTSLPQFVYEAERSESFEVLWHLGNRRLNHYTMKAFKRVPKEFTLKYLLQVQQRPITEFPILYFTSCKNLPKLLIEF